MPAAIVSGCWDHHADWALLELGDALPAVPVRICVPPDIGSRCVILPREGIFHAGPVVLAGDVRAVRDQPIARGIQIFSDELAAGQGIDARGISGAPCVGQNGTFAIVTSAIIEQSEIDPNFERTALGTVFAVPLTTAIHKIRSVVPNTVLGSTLEISDYVAAVELACDSSPYLSLDTLDPKRGLGEVYVNLRAQQRTRVPKNREKGQRSRDRKRGAQQTLAGDTLSPREMLQASQGRPVVVVGQPGSGKSTLTRYLAYHAWARPDVIGFEYSHIPVIARLADFDRVAGPTNDRLRIIAASQLGLDISDDLFAHLGGESDRRYLVLLDGLDEVPEQRRLALIQLLTRILSRTAGVQFVITSRPSAYRSGLLDPIRVDDYSLLPFSPSQLRRFANKWFGADATRFLSALTRGCALELRGTPLLVTIAAKVFAVMRDLPRSRAALYARFVDILLEEGRLVGGGEVLRGMQVHMKGLITWCALRASESSIRSEDEWNGVMAEYLSRQRGCAPADAQELAPRLVDFASTRSGVLVRDGDGISFLHPTLREFCAAKHLIHEHDSDADRIFTIIRMRGLEGTWREIALLASGILGDMGIDCSRPLVENYKSLCGRTKGIRLDDQEDVAYEYLDEHAEALWFIVSAIGGGAKVEAAVERSICRDLCKLVQIFSASEMFKSGDVVSRAIRALGEMRRSRRATRMLRRFVFGDYSAEIQMAAMFARLENGLRVDEVAELLAWGKGERVLSMGVERESEMDQLEIANALTERGFRGLGARVAIAAALEGYLATDAIMLLPETPEELDEDEEDIVALLDASAVGVRWLRGYIDSYKTTISVDQVILGFVGNGDWVKEGHLERFMESGLVKDRKAIERALVEIVADYGRDDWHRADCALAMARHLGNQTWANKIVNDEETESGAREYLRLQLEFDRQKV